MEKIEVIKEEVQALVSKLIDKFDIEVSEDEGAYHVVIKTQEEAPTLIGRYGETIKAIQKLLEVIMYKRLGERTEILINVNDYRERQKERLEEMAEQYVKEVKESRNPSSIGRLSSYERKVIHEYIVASHP